MPLPVALRPHLEVALARPVATMPAPSALPGGCLYEPKWDGFRLLIMRDRDVSLWSRKGTDLTRYFADLAEAAAAQLTAGVVIDGEAVVWREGRLSFDELQHRLSSRGLPLRDRRALLEELASEWSAPLNLSPATRDAGEAAEWLQTMTAAGIEGLVAKGAGKPYRGCQRQRLKVKHRDTLDVVMIRRAEHEMRAGTASRGRRIVAVVALASRPESPVSLVVAGLGSAGRVGAGAPSRRDS